MIKAGAALAFLLSSFLLPTCGGGSPDVSSNAGNAPARDKSAPAGKPVTHAATVIDIATDRNGGYAFTPDSATTKAGKVAVRLVIPKYSRAVREEPVGNIHSLAIEDSRGRSRGQTRLIDKGSDSLVVDLEAGEYTYYCPIPGHREAGMEGTLTVK